MHQISGMCKKNIDSASLMHQISASYLKNTDFADLTHQRGVNHSGGCGRDPALKDHAALPRL